MPKRPLILGNWKMKLSQRESIALAEQLKKSLKKLKEAEVGVCPSFTSIYAVSATLANTNVKVGAQNMFWESEGAYTGEISPLMLNELGCKYVILGHSERRQHLKETDQMVHLKTRLCLQYNLVPIICVGENIDERQENRTDYVIISQLTKALEGIEIKAGDELVIAYEPVWVIGTGQAINPAEAEHVHRVIRQALVDLFNAQAVQNNFRIIYGGSVDSGNAASFTRQKTVDGLLVGAASLKPQEFFSIINEVKNNYGHGL